MRLIDLDSLIVEFNKRCRGECCCCTEDYCGSGNDGCGCRVIDEAPTVDAVEVVRCKDCKHWLQRSAEVYRPVGIEGCACDSWIRITQENDFCSRGERKDEVTECTTHT